MKKLPKEFAELNEKYIYPFNCGNNVALFGEGKYILLQGSRSKGYNINLMEGNIGSGKVVKLLSAGLNKKSFIVAIELLFMLSINTVSTPVYKIS